MNIKKLTIDNKDKNYIAKVTISKYFDSEEEGNEWLNAIEKLYGDDNGIVIDLRED